MKRHFTRAMTAGATFGALMLVAASAAADDTGHGWRPADLSLDGHRSDWLFNYCTVSITTLFVIMVGIIAWAVLRHGKDHKAHYEHGVGRKHLLTTAAFTALVFFGVDGVMLAHSYADLTEAFYKFPVPADDALNIEVMAQQWAWNIRYAGPDNQFNTADDIVTLNDMHVPIGRPIHVKLQAKDVIHSFYLPNFRIKQDAIPGTITQMWFQATAPGIVEIGCAQHCGTNHYKMKGSLTVESKEEFEAWAKAASEDGKRRFDAADTEAQWGWDWTLAGMGPNATTSLGAAGEHTNKAGEGAKAPAAPQHEAK